MNMGVIFVGCIFLIVSIYIFVTQEFMGSGFIFGGGILLALAIITFYTGFTRKKKEEKRQR